jgi:hypothetical protein
MPEQSNNVLTMVHEESAVTTDEEQSAGQHGEGEQPDSTKRTRTNSAGRARARQLTASPYTQRTLPVACRGWLPQGHGKSEAIALPPDSDTQGHRHRRGLTPC